MGYVNVDGTVYSWLGAPNITGTTKANQTSMTVSRKNLEFACILTSAPQFTSTQSTFVLTAGPIDLTVNFLSPVDATDLVKQSLPFSYLAVSAAANDGAAHAVKLYTDISAEWISGDRSLTANWTTTTGDIITHQAQLESPGVFEEVNDQTQCKIAVRPFV